MSLLIGILSIPVSYLLSRPHQSTTEDKLSNSSINSAELNYQTSRLGNESLEERTKENAGQTIKQAEQEASRAEPKRCPVSASEFFSKYKQLGDHFHAKEEFLKEVDGTYAEWVGFVSHVYSDRNKINIQFDIVKENTQLHSFIASFTNDFREKVFALQKGDKIRVNGILKTEHMINTPLIDGISFNLEL